MIETEPTQVLIGQVSDTHVLAIGDVETEVYVDNNARCADAVASINAEQPALDAVIGTGDLTNDARDGEYDALLELLAPLTMPFLPLPGNHDQRAQLHHRFPNVPWSDTRHASWVTEVSGVRLIGLDSTRPGEHGGAVDDERAAWLREVLAADHDGVTILAMHHPPFDSGIRWMDQYGFPGRDLLEAVLLDHPVDRIACGHLHRPMSSMFAGIPVQVGMSTVQHVDLDLRLGGQVAVIDDPIGYQIHRVMGRSVVTHARFIRNEAAVTPSWAGDFD